MKKILFVCLGNICRSSSAEEVMRTLIRKEGLEREIEVDSAGILSYHQGELPDSRMRMHASRRGYNLTHRSRPVCTDDYYGGAQGFENVLDILEDACAGLLESIRAISSTQDN